MIGADLARSIKFRTAKAQWYKTVFDSPDGQMVLADLIKFTNAHEQSFVPGAADETAFHEGMRRVITRIEKLTNMTPKEIQRISEVHRDAEARYGQELGLNEEGYAA